MGAVVRGVDIGSEEDRGMISFSHSWMSRKIAYDIGEEGDLPR